jgi:hypothetical protein
MNNEELLGDHKESSGASLVELGDVRELISIAKTSRAMLFRH